MSSKPLPIHELRIQRPAHPPSSGWGWVLAGVLLVLAGGGGAAWWTLRPKTVPVRTVVAREAEPAGGGRQRTVLNASGYVTARREATVSSKVTGKVVEVLVEEGVTVREGQMLARLDDTNVSASLRLAQAQLDAVKAVMEETRVRIQLAEKDFERQVRLSTNRVASEADFDQARTALHALKARLLMQQAEVVSAERTIATWQQQLDDTVIRAPFAGVVTQKNAQPGEMISPMSSGGYTRTGICTIVDMDSLEIEIDVNESYINRVQPGQPVEATLDAYADWKIPCKVIAIIPTADRQKSTVKVRVGFDKLDPRILPDMAVKVGFGETGAGGRAANGALADAGTGATTGSAESAAAARRGVAVPEGALVKEGAKEIVFVVQGGRAERRAVTVASRGAGTAVLAAGVTAGQRVVVDPPRDLADNALVRDLEDSKAK